MLRRLAHYYRQIDERLNDWRLGISAREMHAQTDDRRPEFRGYAPTSYRDWRIIRRHFTPRGTFIDYGAGLGRVTILAARLPFDTSIGIEFDPELAARAAQHIRAARSRAQIRCIDARCFDIPAGATILYFCNPFTGSVLQSVLDKAKGRDLSIVCNLPPRGAFEGQVRAVPWLNLTKEIALYDQRKCLIFTP